MKKILLFLTGILIISTQLSSQTVNGEIVSDTGNVTVIKVWGTSEERGFALGYLFGDKMLAVYDDFLLPYYGDNLEKIKELILNGTFVFDTVYQNEAKAVIAGMDSAGFNPAGYGYLDVLASNVFNDLSCWPFTKQQDLCSTFMSWNDATAGTDLDGRSVISRHLDWYSIPEILCNTGSIVIHIPSEDGQQPWLIIDFGGGMAPTSGLNQSGYCIFQNGLGGNWMADTNTSYVPCRIIARKVLETTDYNQDGEYNMTDIRDAISENVFGTASGRIFSALGPSTAVHDSMIAFIAEVAPKDPFITFRTNSYNDSIPGDNLYAANDQIARNNNRIYCYRYLNMVNHIGNGTNIGSVSNWEMMRLYSHGGSGSIMFMQFIPEWNQLKLCVCQKINGTITPAYQTDPIVYDLEELFSLPPWLSLSEKETPTLEMTVYPNPCLGAAHLGFTINDYRLTICDLYSISGMWIKELINKEMPAGEHEVEVNMSGLPDGIYLIRLQAGKEVVTKKLVKLHD